MDQHFHNNILNCEWHSAQARVAEIGKYMLNNLRLFEKREYFCGQCEQNKTLDTTDKLLGIICYF